MTSSKAPSNQYYADNDETWPDTIKDDVGASRRHSERMPAKDCVLGLGRWHDAGKRVNRLEHTLRCRNTAHRFGPRELVPDFTITGAALFEKPDRGGGNVPHFELRHHTAQLRECAMFEVKPPRIFGSEMHLDTQRRMDLPQCTLVCFRKRVAAALRCIPTRGKKRGRKDRPSREDTDPGRFVCAAANRDAEPHPT